jgi:cardiolipin synthase A/B
VCAVRPLALVVILGCAPGGATPDATVAVDTATAADAAPSPSHAITIIVEPDGNQGNQLVDAIAAARHAVYMTMYELDSAPVIDALVGRARAGLDVQVILDGSTTNKSFNTPAYDQLTSAGVAVVWSNPAFTYTHEKCVMIDGASAWIMTMNANTSSPNVNREYLAVDTDPADVAEAVAVFHADHAMQTITPVGSLVVANTNARPSLVALIDAATSTLDVEGEEFSDTYSTGVVRAVARAAQRGVAVHVVIATSTLDATAVALVKNAGALVVTTGPTSGHGTAANPYIHAKAIAVDCAGGTCARGFVGSENFSAGSLGYNREVGVIFDTTVELAKLKTAIDLDFGHGVAQ